MLSIITQQVYGFDYSPSAPTQVTLDGSQSQDSQGRTIASVDCELTQFEWLLLSKPDGASDPSLSTSGVLGSSATVTIPAGIEGSFLYLLRVYEGVDFSPTSLSVSPNSAFSAIGFRSEELNLELVAEGERNHGDRDNANLIKIDDAIQLIRTDVSALAPTPIATTVLLGKSRLNEANDPPSGADPNSPEVVNADGVTWRTLSLGGVATGLHTHPEYVVSGGSSGTGGMHRDLRPDLLTGTYDKVWSDSLVGSALMLDDQNSSSALVGTNRQESIDGNLLIECGSVTAGKKSVTLARIQTMPIDVSTETFWAMVDMRLHPLVASSEVSQKLDSASSTESNIEAMFIAEFRDSNTSTTPLYESFGGSSANIPSEVAQAVANATAQQTAVAVGWSMHDWTSKAMEFGTTPFLNTLNGDGTERVLSKGLEQGSLYSEVTFAIKYYSGVCRPFIGMNGGWFAIGNPQAVSPSSPYDTVDFYMGGTTGSDVLNLRIETTGLRIIRTTLDDFGVTPQFEPYSGLS